MATIAYENISTEAEFAGFNDQIWYYFVLFCFSLLKPVPPVIYPSKENPVDTAVVKGRVLNTKQ